MHWIAHYDDGRALKQSPEYTYKDIDRAHLITFDLWQDERLIIRIDLRQDSQDKDIGQRRLIWRMRNIQRTDGTHAVIHLAGWQRTIAGHNVQAITYVFDDGTIVLGGQFTGTEFMDKIVPLDFEDDLK